MEQEIKIKISRRKLVILAVVFVAGFAGGMLTEHIIHLVQAKQSGHHSAEHHDEHTH
jgi:hypothetical protein